jgi:L-lactate dehydrogenase complex protein LldF
LLFKLRAHRVSAGHTNAFEKFAFGMWKRFFKLPSTYKFAMKAASLGQKPLVKDGYITAQLPLLSNWTNSRYLPAAADKTFRDRWNKRKK